MNKVYSELIVKVDYTGTKFLHVLTMGNLFSMIH